MRRSVLFLLVFLLSGFAYGDDDNDAESDSLIRSIIDDFMSALQAGDGLTASELFSSQAMEQVEVMLVSVKQNLDRDPEAALRRLNGAGYTIELKAAEDWEIKDYLSATLSLPMITARYAPYELEINSVTLEAGSALVDMIFRTATGVEIPQQAVMTYEDDNWMITSFMGITAFP
ncbi:MAG: hypothetical protein KAR40_05610 [Candidatus Sabulitectum sp.]|nr:hypothetical protein [Candidatus Sabulitectum sp.]